MDSQIIGTIECKTKVFECEWTIPIDMEFQSKTNAQKVISSTFSTCIFGKEIKWCLILYPKGDSPNSEDFLSLYVKSLSTFKIESTASLSLFDQNKSKIKECQTKHLYSRAGESWGYPKFVANNFINNSIGQITLVCKLVIDTIKLEENDESFNRLKEFDDFEKLLTNEKFSDLSIFSAEKKKLHVHKGVLSARSPVFEAMFEHDMAEKKQNFVDIKDIRYEVLLEVFRFMYCGKVNEIESIILELLQAADKYSIKGLKLMCEETMLINLTELNALDYFVAFHINNCSHVNNILEFIVKNPEAFVKTEKFRSLTFSHPDLALTIMNGIVYNDMS